MDTYCLLHIPPAFLHVLGVESVTPNAVGHSSVGCNYAERLMRLLLALYVLFLLSAVRRIVLFTEAHVLRMAWNVQYRSRGTYTRVKKNSRVISARHASGERSSLEYECSRARVILEYEGSSGKKASIVQIVDIAIARTARSRVYS